MSIAQMTKDENQVLPVGDMVIEADGTKLSNKLSADGSPQKKPSLFKVRMQVRPKGGMQGMQGMQGVATEHERGGMCSVNQLVTVLEVCAERAGGLVHHHKRWLGKLAVGAVFTDGELCRRPDDRQPVSGWWWCSAHCTGGVGKQSA